MSVHLGDVVIEWTGLEPRLFADRLYGPREADRAAKEAQAAADATGSGRAYNTASVVGDLP